MLEFDLSGAWFANLCKTLFTQDSPADAKGGTRRSPPPVETNMRRFFEALRKWFVAYLRCSPSPTGRDVCLQIGNSTGICWLKKYGLTSVTFKVSTGTVSQQTFDHTY